MSKCKSVGFASAMPGSGGGLTMVCFNGKDVPAGTEVFIGAEAFNTMLEALQSVVSNKHFNLSDDVAKAMIAIALATGKEL